MVHGASWKRAQPTFIRFSREAGCQICYEPETAAEATGCQAVEEAAVNVVVEAADL